jgi:integrase
VKGKNAWYIEYYYRIPVAVRHLYDNKEWYRFRVTEDLNRRKGDDQKVYSEWLIDEVIRILAAGYNPFEPDLAGEEAGQDEIELPKVMTAKDGLQLFLEKWALRGLEARTKYKYEHYIGRLIDWLIGNNLHNKDMRLIDSDHIEQFLQDQQKEFKFGNREYNNTMDFVRTAFIFLKKKKHIDSVPTDGLTKLRAKVSKHRYYDEATLQSITKALINQDPYTYLACQTVYHLCIRSDKELMNLKVGNILWDQDKVFAEAEGTKGNADRYIPMDSKIKALLKNHLANKYPAEYYVFGINGEPAAKPFGNGFFAKRFRKVRDAAGISDQHTIYGFKHTRVINLKQDGATDADIMSLTGHRDFGAYAKYLRDLGLAADASKISALSRSV